MADYSFDAGPTPIQYTIPLAALKYMLRLNERGLIEGPIGDQHLSAEVDAIIRALHVVLAGGEVKIEITERGDPDLVRQLDTMLEDAHKASNEINAKAGYYVTIQV